MVCVHILSRRAATGTQISAKRKKRGVMNSISYQYSTAATSSAIKENKDTVFNTSNKKLNHLRNAKYIVPLCLFNSSSPSFAAMIASSPFLLLL